MRRGEKLPQRTEFPRLGLLLSLIVLFALLSLLFFYSPVVAQLQRMLRKVTVLFFAIMIARYTVSVRNSVVPVPPQDVTWRQAVSALALAALVCSPVTLLSFFCDDYAHLLAGSGGAFSAVMDSFSHGLALNRYLYRPFAFSMLLLESKLWRTWAAGYHLVGLLLHLTSATAIFFLGRRIGLDASASVTASALFAVLPINAEAVAWISCQYDLIATVLMILAAVFYLRFVQEGQVRNYGVCALLLLLAMLSKESAFVFPLLLLSLQLFIVRQRRVMPVLGIFVLAGAGFLLRWRILGGLGGYSDAAGNLYALDFRHSFQGLLLHAPASELFGLNWLQPQGSVVLLLAFLTAVLLLVSAIFGRPRPNGVMPFALSWMLISLLPTHSLLFIGPALIGSHIRYLSSVGIVLLLAALFTGFRPATGKALIVALLAVFSAGMLHNLAAWYSASVAMRSFGTQLVGIEPAPPYGALLFFDGLPDFDHGVCFAGAGLNATVQVIYGRKDLTARNTPATAPAAPQIRFRWTQDKVLLKMSEAVR